MNPTPTPTPSLPLETLLAERVWVRSLARSLVRDENRADDLEQQTLLAALEHPPVHGDSPRGWLATVMRRAAGRERRGDWRRDRRQAVAVGPAAAPATADVVAQAEWHGRVVQAVLALDEPYRTTLLLRFFEDLAPREVAARMNAPVETVRSRVQRGLAKLRETFDAKHGGDRRAWALPLIRLATGRRSGRRAGDRGMGRDGSSRGGCFRPWRVDRPLRIRGPRRDRHGGGVDRRRRGGGALVGAGLGGSRGLGGGGP